MSPEDAPPASTPPPKTHPGRGWFEALLVFLVLLVAGGAPAPGVNEAHYLCRLKHFWAPADYCPGDLFLESPDAHFTVVWLLGWVTRLVSLEATAWIGRVLSWALIAAGWQRLVRRVTARPFLAPLGAALLVLATRQFHFAGEWLVGGFEAKTLAYGFVLFGLADAIDGRWNRCWLLLGAASALHALVGGWSVVALGLALLGISRPPLRTMLPGLVGGGLLSLAGVLPALALNADTPPEVVAEANEVYVYFRLPHHLAPLTKETDWVAERVARHAVLLIGLALLHATRVDRTRPALRLLTRFAWAAEAISLAGLLISLVGWNDHAWSASLLRYYWHRLADIAAPIAVVAIALEWLGAGLQAERRVAAYVATGLLAIATAYLGSISLEIARDPTPAGDASMRDPAAWVEMCEWVRQNTEPDARLLVPFNSATFKWRAQRAEVVNRKDIPQDAASLVEWRRRLSEVFQTGEWADGSPRWTPSLARLGAARLRELGQKYGAQYMLDQPSGWDLRNNRQRRVSLPVVHRVGPYTLYRL